MKDKRGLSMSNYILKIKKIPYIIFICLILYCTQNAENKLNKGIELYNNGQTSNARISIEDGLINSALIMKFNESQLLFGENVLFYKKKKIIKIVWPIDLNIEINDNYDIISYNPDLKRIGLSNGYDIKIYNSNGDLIKTCGPTPDEKQIKAFTVINEKIYYYKDKKIYFYELNSDIEKLFTNDRFLTPVDNEPYEVKFYKTENALAVVAGIAGKYNLTVFDITNDLKTFQNLNIASSRLFFKYEEIYYISGSAGKYSIVKTPILSTKTKKLIEFDSLQDIELFLPGIIFENKDGFWIADYENNNRQRIPFNYSLAGQCSGNPIIKYSNIYYMIDMAGFLDKITYIKEKAPSLFDETN